MRLSNVVIATHDYERMVDFYKRLTGWPAYFESDDCCFLGWAAPYVVLHRVGPETEVEPPVRTLCLDFDTPDLDAEIDRLAMSGLLIERRGDLAVLRDPAGNLVEIVPGQ